MFFLPSHGVVKSFAPVKGPPPSLFQCSQGLKNTKEPSHDFSKLLPKRTRLCDVSRTPPSQFDSRFHAYSSAASTQHMQRASSRRRAPSMLQLSLPTAHEKTRHSPQGRASRRGAGMLSAHATASPHRQFSTERACCSNRARSRSCAHRASACCRERVRGTCGGRTHRASQRRPYG